MTKKSNPVIFKTDSVIFITDPVIFKTNPVIFRTNPVIFRTNLDRKCDRNKQKLTQKLQKQTETET